MVLTAPAAPSLLTNDCPFTPITPRSQSCDPAAIISLVNNAVSSVSGFLQVHHLDCAAAAFRQLGSVRCGGSYRWGEDTAAGQSTRTVSNCIKLSHARIISMIQLSPMQASAFRQQVVRGSNQPTSRAFGQQERPVPNLEQPLFQMILMERIPTNSTQGGRITARISAENILPLGVMCSIYKAPLYADEQTVALSSNCFAERFNLKITLIYLFFFVGFSSMSFYFDWHELGTQERRMIREPSRSKNCLLAGVLRRRYGTRCPISRFSLLRLKS